MRIDQTIQSMGCFIASGQTADSHIYLQKEKVEWNRRKKKEILLIIFEIVLICFLDFRDKRER